MKELVGDESEIFDRKLSLKKLDILWEAIDQGNPEWSGEFDLIWDGDKCYAILGSCYYLYDFTDCWNIVRVE